MYEKKCHVEVDHPPPPPLLPLPQVSAKSKAEYTVEFVPLAMTSSSPPPTTLDSRTGGKNGSSPENGGGETVGDDGKPFRLLGSLFFALPDGGAVLYRLEGVATDPEAASVIELETPAKTALAFTVPVCNWLRHPQR